MDTKNKYEIGTTISRKDKNAFKIFCTQNDLREGNTLRSLLVWLKQLNKKNQELFFEKYLSKTSYGRGDKTATFHVYFSSQQEVDEIQQMAREIQGRIRTIKLSYTTLLLSLIKWLQNLPEESLLAFRKKYYLPGLYNTLEAIKEQAKYQSSPEIDVAIKNFTEQIISSDNLNKANKDELTEMLSYLASQITKKENRRDKFVSKAILDTLNKKNIELGITSGLNTAWGILHPLLTQLFG
jgi:hypothetical protein